MVPVEDAPSAPGAGGAGGADAQLTDAPLTADAQLTDDEARRLRAARRHDLGRPAVTSHKIGDRRYLVAEVQPLDVDGVRTMQVGSVLWLLAFLVLLPFVGRLRDADRGWWLITCLLGLALGLIGWEYCRRRRRALLGDPRRRRIDTHELGPLG